MPAIAGEVGVSHTIGNYVRHGAGRMQFRSVKNEDVTESTSFAAKQFDLFKYGEETQAGHSGRGLELTEDFGRGNNGNGQGGGNSSGGSSAGRGFSGSFVSVTGSRNLTSNEVINATGGEDYTFSESNFTRRSSAFSF